MHFVLVLSLCVAFVCPQALQYINATLTSAKTNLNRVLQTNVMMANLTDMEAINKEYLAFFGMDLWTCVCTVERRLGGGVTPPLPV